MSKDDEIFYREGQVNAISWKEINESYLGLFGYTEILNPLITQKEILTTLKDIDLLRKNPQMYPTEELNIWEYKLSNWLKLYDNDKSDSESEREIIEQFDELEVIYIIFTYNSF
jgi:hypothetical protein